jgi:excisionase family DNA binding protein
MNEKRVPTMLTVREVARTGILPEHAIRLLLKDGKLPAIFVGKKAFINFEKLLELLESSTRPKGGEQDADSNRM